MLANKSKKLLSLLMALAMTATLLPATAFADEELGCGKEAHTHKDACYTQKLVCTLEVSEGHTHGEDCDTDSEAVLSCDNEDPEHIHGPECSIPGEPAVDCGIDASEGHTHTEACYKSVLTCTQEEHEHSEDCVQAPAAAAPMANSLSVEESNIVYTDGQGNPVDPFRVSEYHFPNDVVAAMKQMAVDDPDFKTSGRSFTELVLNFKSGPGLNAGPLIGMWRATVGTGERGNPENLESISLKYYDWGNVRTYSYVIPVDELAIHCYDKGGAALPFAQIGLAIEEPGVEYHTVTFDWGYKATEGETNTLSFETVADGETVTSPEVMRDGYQFLGWYLDDDSDKFNFDTQITGDITLTARWEEDADKGDTVTLIIQYNHENNGVGNDGKGGHDGPATQEELEKVVADARAKLGGGYDETIANTVIEVNISDGKNGTTSAITLTLYKDALEENKKFDLSKAGFAPTELLRGCELTGGSTTANFNGSKVEETIKLLYKCSDSDISHPAAYFVLDPVRGIPASGADQGVENYLPNGTDNGGVEGCNDITGYKGGFITQKAADKIPDLADRYENMDGFGSDDITPPPAKNLGRFSDANIVWYNIMKPGAYGNTVGEDTYYYHVDGYVKNYNVAVTYHSNFGTDATYNDKTVTGPSYTTKTYSDILLPERPGYEFQGWSEASGESNAVTYKENESFTLMTELQLYAVWTATGTPPPAGGKTTVSVWHYYGANSKPVQGAPVDAQNRDSQLITEDWVNGLKSMEFYTGEDADCFQYTGFEIMTLADDATEYQPVDPIDGHVDLTGLRSVAVHLTYDENFAPIVYHSNYGADATERVLVEKGGDGTYPDHTVLGYGETGLTSHGGYTFQGWSTTATGTASISAGTAQSVTSAGLEFYAVWSPNGGGNPPGGGDDRPDRPSRPTVTPPVEEEIILPGEVPLGDAPVADAPAADAGSETVVTPPEDGANYAIVDEGVPLGNLPQTGTAAQAVDPAWTLGLLALAASMAAAGLAVTITRKREDEI